MLERRRRRVFCYQRMKKKKDLPLVDLRTGDTQSNLKKVEIWGGKLETATVQFTGHPITSGREVRLHTGRSD